MPTPRARSRRRPAAAPTRAASSPRRSGRRTAPRPAAGARWRSRAGSRVRFGLSSIALQTASAATANVTGRTRGMVVRVGVGEPGDGLLVEQRARPAGQLAERAHSPRRNGTTVRMKSLRPGSSKIGSQWASRALRSTSVTRRTLAAARERAGGGEHAALAERRLERVDRQLARGRASRGRRGPAAPGSRRRRRPRPRRARAGCGWYHAKPSTRSIPETARATRRSDARPPPSRQPRGSPAGSSPPRCAWTSARFAGPVSVSIA